MAVEAQDRIAYIIVMRGLGIVEKNNIFQLC